MERQARLEWSLFMIRITVFLVLLVWTFDKFLNPAHGSAVFEHFYFVAGVSHTVVQALGAAELVIILAFVLGLRKTWTYGAVLVFHALSTLLSFKVYLDPIGQPNILFWAAWPMLAACVTLFLLRADDRKFSLGKG